MSDALFRRDGDLYHPTELTEGPWSPDAQHGGPPAALLAGAVERAPADVEMVVARITVELLRPVPLQPLVLTSEVVRPGRKVQLVAASLVHEGSEVARALGLRIRLGDVDLQLVQPDTVVITRPDIGRPVRFFDKPGAFATDAMEVLMIDGNFNEAGPGKAWFRLKVPLVMDEETTAVQRVAAAADFGNGLSNLAGTERRWVFINPDLEIRMSRPPAGQWVYLDSTTMISPTGTGLARSMLADEQGWLGVAAQSLFVDVLPDK